MEIDAEEVRELQRLGRRIQSLEEKMDELAETSPAVKRFLAYRTKAKDMQRIAESRERSIGGRVCADAYDYLRAQRRR